MGWRLTALNLGLRMVARTYLEHVRDPGRLRRSFVRSTRANPVAPFSWFLDDRLGADGQAVPALWAINRAARGRGVILYFHGGGYISGSPATHAALGARLSALSGMRMCLPDYRLAPEHPFPAAPIDALVAYRALLARGYPPRQIILGGDSAGGGLMFALLHMIAQERLPMPGRVFALSPWTDLTLDQGPRLDDALNDPLLPFDRVRELRDLYMAGADPHDPRATPLLGDFRGGPPAMIQVGSAEMLLDDSRRMAAHLRAQGIEVRLDVWPQAPHVWQNFQGRLPEADRALAQLAGFVSGRR